MWLLILSAVFVLLLVKKYLDNLKYGDVPGPSAMLSLPLIGHGYLLGDDPAAALDRLRRKYGPVFRFDIGDDPTVVIADYAVLHEAFKRDVFNGRYWNLIPTLMAQQPVGPHGENCTKKPLALLRA